MSLETIKEIPTASGRINAPITEIPMVSFDVSLGKHYDDIDFDYSAYEEIYSDMGRANASDSRTNIRVGFVSSKRGVRGEFNPVRNDLEVRIPKNGGSETERIVARVLIHETQHYVDFRDLSRIYPKDFGTFSALKGNLSRVTKIAGYGLVVPSELCYFVFSTSFGYVLGSCALSALGVVGEKHFYKNSIREKRARAAADKYYPTQPQLVKLSPKSTTEQQDLN